MADSKDEGKKGQGGIGGFFGNLIELVEKLTELAEKGEELKKSGNLTVGELGDKKLKGVYGFSVRTGIGGEGPKVEPFGNIRKDRKTGESVVHEIHEPMVDVFDEEDHIMVLAEMPGIEAEDIQLEVHGDVLTISAVGEDRKYRKEILLPVEILREKMNITYRNGIAKIRCDR